MQHGIELWAGAECTVNRVGDRYFDQVVRTGHHDREEDIDRLADLGARAVRFPILWERHAPRSLDECDFTWADPRLARLRERSVRPIAGLVHHGSGPTYATLVDDAFVEGLARYARVVAERYPWITEWTPVNEPLTTARFAGLYGFWYPHGRSKAMFLRALTIQVAATRAAMRAIREVVPDAQLVQTEDHGRIFGTPTLAYQWAYENHRRWLSLDLLAGRVDRRHPLRHDLVEHGVDARLLDSFVDEPCTPDVIGANYYLTSDRHIDHRIARYPERYRGGNGRHRYADVEAVRVPEVQIAGHRTVLVDAWRRYRKPVAITEVHLGCTREEQLRWIHEAWRGAHEARSQGADVRAVTLWSVFGCVDWSSLLTEERGHYESGVYDLRAPVPRPTAIVQLARDLANERPPIALAAADGWWRRPDRVLGAEPGMTPVDGPPLYLVGSGALAPRLVRACAIRGIATRQVSLAQSLGVVAEACAAIVLEAPRGEPSWCRTVEHAARWSRECNERGVPCVIVSSDLVFEGRSEGAYHERDTTGPHCREGRALDSLERAILGGSSALVARSGPLFDPDDDSDPLVRSVYALADGRVLRLGDDEIVSPTWAADLVDALLDLTIDGERGVVHLANPGAVSWFDFVAMTAASCGVSTKGLTRTKGRGLRPGARTGWRALTSERVTSLLSLEAAIERGIAPRVRDRLQRVASG